jgi:hypothetical protein
MKISDWLDEKLAEGFDVSQIVVPDDLSYDEAPDETIFLRRLILAESSVPAIIHFLRSSVLDTGIIVEVKTRRPVFTRQEWSGDCLRGIEISLSKQLNHT